MCCVHVCGTIGNRAQVSLRHGFSGSAELCLPPAECYHVTVGEGLVDYQVGNIAYR